MRCIYPQWAVPHNRRMVKKRQDPERVAIPMEKELLDQIDEYRWAHRIPSRAEAIRQLVREGLKAKK